MAAGAGSSESWRIGAVPFWVLLMDSSKGVVEIKNEGCRNKKGRESSRPSVHLGYFLNDQADAGTADPIINATTQRSTRFVVGYQMER